MEIKTIIWIFIGIFSLTAIITLLGITNVLKGIKEKYLNKLFYTLIIEVVIAVVAVFKGVDFNQEGISMATILHKAKLADTFESEDDRADYIIEQLKQSSKIPELVGKLTAAEVEQQAQLSKNNNLKLQLDSCGKSLNKIEKSFYSKIIKLREQISNYSGFINLKYRPQEKTEVFAILKDIFEILGVLKDGEEDIASIQALYKQFELDYGLYKEGELIVTEYETSILIRAYLKKVYPVLLS